MGLNRKLIQTGSWSKTGSGSKQEVDPNRKLIQTGSPNFLFLCIRTIWYRKNQLTSGKNQLTSGKNQLISCKNQLTSGKNQLTSCKNQLTWGKNQLTFGKNQLTCSKNQLISGKNQLKQKISWRKKSADAKNQLTQKISWRKYPKYWKKKVYSAGPGEPLNREKKSDFFSSTLALSPILTLFSPFSPTFTYF